MAVQAPLFSGLPVNAASQDWMVDGFGYGLPDPFTDPGQTFQVNEQPGSAELLGFHPVRFSSQVLSGELERQRREIDLFLHLQSEKLKHTIQEQKKRQLSAMLRSIESKAGAMMRKAEQDLAEATSKTRELENCLRRAEMETEVWERVAKDNEAMILGLNNMLGQAHEKLYWASRPNSESQAQDAESACEVDVGEEDDKMRCKWCRKQISCIVFLPCRHLCACKECGSLLEMCPVCQTLKQGGIEVFLN